MFISKLLHSKKAWGVVVVGVVAIGLIVGSQNNIDTNQLATNSYQPLPNRPAKIPNIVAPDFPVYPNAAVYRMTNKPPNEFAIGYGSDDAPSKIYAYLLEDAKANNWNVIAQKPQELIFRASKDNTTITISVSKKSGEETAILEQMILGVSSR